MTSTTVDTYMVASDHSTPVNPLNGSAVVKVLTGDTVYYTDQPYITSTANLGSLTAGQSHTFSTPAWLLSASLSSVSVTLTATPDDAALDAAAVATAEAASLPVATTLDLVPGAAADVNLHSHRITNLADATTATDALNREAGDTRYPQRSATAGGALTPTATRTSTIDVPALRDFISVMDFAAKGDAKQVTDGAIASGQATLSSASASFTSADVGKTVNVVGAGTTGGVLSATISSVSGGVATLSATASTTVASGGTVNYGTLDTTAVQNALNAVSTAGGGIVLLPAGVGFMVGTLTPKNNVTLWAYGATVYMDSAASTGLFWYTANLSKWAVRGGNFLGTGKEAQNQTLFQGNTATTCTDIVFADLYVNNWWTGPLYMRNPVRVKAVGNRFISCGGQPALYNIINLVCEGAQTFQVQELIITDNIVTSGGTQAIALVGGANATADSLRCIVANNTVSGALGTGGINIEFSTNGTGEYDKVIVANNHVTTTTASGTAFGIGVSGVLANTDPLFLRRVIVTGNTVDSARYGMNIQANDAIVTNNYVNCTGWALLVGKNGATTATTGDVANSSATISNVSGGASVPNGAPLSGTGIPAGTFLQSGAGTATWTMSQAATGGTTGQAVTVYAQYANNLITNNVLHCQATPTNYPVNLYGLRNSTVNNNRVLLDTGSAAASFDGVYVNFCGWMTIAHNDIEYAPASGVKISNSNDFDLHGNRIYNPSDGAANHRGVRLSNLSGTLARIADNVIVDDRGTHNMKYGVDSGDGGIATGLPIEVLRNAIRGPNTTALNGTFTRKRDNTYTSGASEGRAVLSSGTVTVSTAEIQTADNVILTRNVAGGTIGEIQLGTITAGTSFVINSVQPGTASTVQSADTSTVYWRIDH